MAFGLISLFPQSVTTQFLASTGYTHAHAHAHACCLGPAHVRWRPSAAVGRNHSIGLHHYHRSSTPIAWHELINQPSRSNMYVRIYVRLKWTFSRRTFPNSVSGPIQARLFRMPGTRKRCQTGKGLNPRLELQLVGKLLDYFGKDHGLGLQPARRPTIFKHLSG